MYIYPTTSTSTNSTPSPPSTTSTNPPPQTPLPLLAQTTNRLLRRRYALLTSLTTCPIFGILINTLSVKNYLSSISSIQSLIAAAGKKSYTFVVGKVNAAKVANFAEIGGWVVVGCWESCLLDDTNGEFFRPVITPWELELALMGDEERVWTGVWRGGLDVGEGKKKKTTASLTAADDGEETKQPNEEAEERIEIEIEDPDSEPESQPPEFDLRTGRYVSHTRPMLSSTTSTTIKSSGYPTSSSTSISSPSNTTSTPAASNALLKRPTPSNLALASINGTISPGAEFLNQRRTWRGLGSDFVDAEDGEVEVEGRTVDRQGAVVEEGRRGVARGYSVGVDESGDGKR